MRFRCSIVLAFFACSSCLISGCGSADRVTVKTQPKEVKLSQVQYVNPLAAADTVLRRELRFIAAAVNQMQRQPETDPTPPPDPVSTSLPVVTAAAFPYPVSSMRCPEGAIKDEIRAVFGGASEWAESVAWRESNCRPEARNGGSGSAGVFQLLGHDDLLRAACPAVDPSASWAFADCNIRAAKSLYDGSGIAPWRL